MKSARQNTHIHRRARARIFLGAKHQWAVHCAAVHPGWKSSSAALIYRFSFANFFAFALSAVYPPNAQCFTMRTKCERRRRPQMRTTAGAKWWHKYAWLTPMNYYVMICMFEQIFARSRAIGMGWKVADTLFVCVFKHFCMSTRTQSYTRVDDRKLCIRLPHSE